ncbi:MAG: tyrosine phenol-lyase, partial [candidate division Zixibacteria bacterium]
HGNEIFPPIELVRIAVPRRVYTESHLKYAASVFARMAENKRSIKGLKITYAPELLRHFTAEFEELS